jgi:hypothetical protein
MAAGGLCAICIIIIIIIIGVITSKIISSIEGTATSTHKPSSF